MGVAVFSCLTVWVWQYSQKYREGYIGEKQKKSCSYVDDFPLLSPGYHIPFEHMSTCGEIELFTGERSFIPPGTRPVELPWWLSGEESTCQCRRHRFDPWIGQIPWRRAWQPAAVFLPGESPWTEGAGGLQSRGSQRVRHSWARKHRR